MAARSACAALLSIGLALAAAAGRSDDPPPQQVDLALAGWPIGEPALVDQIGRPVTQQALQGQWTFVLVTSDGCSEPCAGALAALAGLYRRIARAAALRTTQVIVVSLDPRHTPAELYGRLVTFDPRFVAAGGPPAAVAALARELGVADVPAAPPPEEDAGALWLIDSNGVIRAQRGRPGDPPVQARQRCQGRGAGVTAATAGEEHKGPLTLQGLLRHRPPDLVHEGELADRPTRQGEVHPLERRLVAAPGCGGQDETDRQERGECRARRHVTPRDPGGGRPLAAPRHRRSPRSSPLGRRAANGQR